MTEYELVALQGKYNLADGHARFDLKGNYKKIIDILSKSDPSRLTTGNVEEEFYTIFFKLANQKIADWSTRILFCPSASESIEIIANYLRLQSISTSLMEPVFDNLADILKRHSVLRGVLQEDKFREVGLLNYCGGITADAYFFVLPNNPTGLVVDKDTFINLVDYCVSAVRHVSADDNGRKISAR